MVGNIPPYIGIYEELDLFVCHASPEWDRSCVHGPQCDSPAHNYIPAWEDEEHISGTIWGYGSRWGCWRKRVSGVFCSVAPMEMAILFPVSASPDI